MKPFILLLSLLLLSATITANPLGNKSGQITDYLGRAERNGFSGSVLVSVEGQIIVDKGLGMADREEKKAETSETIFSIGSITKQFTAAAIVRLVADGKLAVTDKLSRHFRNVPDDKKDITLQQLLTHTAGFRDALGNDYDPLSADRYATLAFSSPLAGEPGKEYLYSNVGYSLLGIIVEKVSGMGYERFLREKFFVPSGMMHTGYVIPDFNKTQLAVGYRDGERWGTALDRPWLADGPGWHLRANGGILSTTGDMNRWIRALKSGTALPEDAVRELWTPHVKEGPDAPSSYGYGWVVEGDGKERLVWHNGGNGVYNAYASYSPETDVIIIVSSNSNDKVSDRVAERIRAIVGGQYISIDQATIDEFSGTYSLPTGAHFALRIDENNTALTTFDDPQIARLMLADGTEKEPEARSVENRTLDLIRSSLAGQYEPLARALGVPADEAGADAHMFWENQQKANGNVKSIDPFVTVARSRRGLILSFIKISFEQSTRYMIYVWKGDNLVDIRPMMKMEREFEQRQGMTFSSPVNDVSVRLGKDSRGNPQIIVQPQQRDEVTFRRMSD